MSETITITGNVATEPERRGNGTPITSFRLASTQRRFDKEAGRWIDGHTNWYTVSAFRQLADHVVQSLHKGQRVIVTGRLRVRTWETASGKGVNVDIDAEAIGHDLRWGTTDFRKDDSEASRAPTAEWEVARTGAGDQWATPMSGSDESSSGGPGAAPASSNGATSVPAADVRPEPAYAGEQTPF